MIKKALFTIGKGIIVIGGVKIGEKIFHYVKEEYKHQQEMNSWKQTLKNTAMEELAKRGMIDDYDVDTDEDDDYITIKINPKKA